MRRMVTTTPRPTLGAAVERSRLEHRARRLERVLVVLWDHRARADAASTRHAALGQAIAGFGDELRDAQARLRLLS
jgi:hypothetical protein